ncbi:protein phosphatase 1 regulatory subunit 35 [Ahaetulla prasina]|uniref:protein phosphatase 1 regulatory subunit 35 n=1 Tax=Ahaetulla prasina TaxID=499056 RepID=UPI00264971E0|nr:protein phosphatase 1 regulatory subunit 35 [Ahaetulla prasina]
MAGALPAGPRESLPCAAPSPLPPPSPCCSPDPAVALTPERSGAAGGGGGGGILRREQQEKPAPRHVRFRIAEQKEEPPPRVGFPGDPQGVSRAARKEPRGAPARSRSPPAPNQLGAPLPHSSLALGAEVRATREQAFDARQAAEQLVQRSFVARCAAEARVGEGLNIPREQQLYRGLISLQVPAEEVLSSALQGRLALVQNQPERERKEAAGEGPDLMAFYRPRELFTETPFLEVGGLPPLKLQAQRRHPATTFLMYRKLQQWAG